MGKSWRQGEQERHASWGTTSGRRDKASLGSDSFELYAEEVFEDTAIGRFAKERWSEGPRRRRSQWLRQQLDLASEGDENAFGYFSQPG